MRGILPQHHVVRGAGRDEDNGCHVIEALDPFTPLISLATNVEHAGKFGEQALISCMVGMVVVV